MSNSDRVKQLQDDIFSAYYVTSRPAGREWVCIVLDLARRIMDADSLAEDITADDLAQLVTDNYHTAAEAVKILIDLRGRA